MEFSVLRHVQFGVDIATSVTILGAMVSWFINQRRIRKEDEERREQERRVGINETTRAVVTETIQGVVADLSKQLIGLAGRGVNIENYIAQGDHEDQLVEVLDQGNFDINFIEEELPIFRNQVLRLYESAATSRYLLIPSLYALPGGQNAIQRLNGDIEDIRLALNRILGGHIELLAALKPLWEVSEALNIDCEAEGAGEIIEKFQEDYHEQIGAIIFNEEYLSFVVPFMPEEHREPYRKFIKNRSQGKEIVLDDYTGQLIMSAVHKFTIVLLSQPNRMKAYALIEIGKEVKVTRTECKAALVNLSAIACKVISKDNAEAIAVIANKFQSDTYFDLDNDVR